ncbi:hypothetical protein VTH82DRAFT_6209 [Thermothelomyces myriococcoides]
MASTRWLALAALNVFSLFDPSNAIKTPIEPRNGFGPSEAAARKNAFDIFNAIHSAMRQWGSSLNHNGMSAFVVTIPEGVLLHHGTNSPNPPYGPEWLAFEIEHAELFARPYMPKLPKRPAPGLPPYSAILHPLLGRGTTNTNTSTSSADADADADANAAAGHGYLHTYLTTSPIPLLYLDGSSAGNTVMGTLDTQDLLLRGNRSAPLMDEFGRASELCELVGRWGLLGMVRMEAGFEVIKCPPEFTRGMRLLTAARRPHPGQPGYALSWSDVFEFVRAIARRYRGIGGGRVQVDWSSMVSAFFYDVDLSGGKWWPRLVGLSDAELGAIRERIGQVAVERAAGGKRTIDWQGVVDLIVARYSERLRYFTEAVDTIKVARDEINGLLNTYIIYDEPDEGHQAAIDRCAKFYLRAVTPETQEDHLILAAVETVTQDICSTLFRARKLIVEDPEADAGSLDSARNILQELVDKLRWTTWKECGACGADEAAQCWNSRPENN